MDIQLFEIRGLHGRRNYSIKIRDNRLIMVGVNGLGKTTVVTLLYLILSRQWHRVLDYDFESVSIAIDGKTYTLKQEEGKGGHAAIARRLQEAIRRESTEYSYGFSNDVWERLALIGQAGSRESLAAELDQLLPLPTSVCRRIAATINLDAKVFNKQAVSALENELSRVARHSQVLFLPTYRRIEKELSFIFPDLEGSIHSFQRRKGVLTAETGRNFIELVEFGMEDVEGTFNRTKTQLVETARSELNSLAGGYLRDVIRGEGDQYDPRLFRYLDDATIDRILNRAEERTLAESDKTRLRTVISTLRGGTTSQHTSGDRYIAHFFAKLVSVDRALSEREQLLVRFAAVCNKYLSGKRMVYEDKDSSICVRLVPSDEPLPLKVLSSGEKQIISLFSHLYLRGERSYFVIIDEPELSLSVKWQQQLLPDILDTGRCEFLAAVTHSPFIFTNELDTYTANLEDCVSEAKR